jgi:co-chaperonin GroES (HSP10)
MSIKKDIHMIGDRCLIEPDNTDKTSAGLIVPERMKGAAALEGTVVAFGPDCTTVMPGDFVSFATYSKFQVPSLEGEYKDHLIVNEADILIVWREEDDGTEEYEG